ncbi:DUF362 domain-containing protein [uncultured Methanolobus sp.]|uniref:DUF362 domain-containing protein n=1 Tax=uncultured Methanolobus sp. TaxID=218300 RepID=UPI0029C92FEE|nr:DUF362 domain-containing protein [uncultured Methanolobus sp.]
MITGNCSALTKIAVGLAVIVTFVGGSTLLYLDTIQCGFPFWADMSGSEFMFHTDTTGIEPDSVHVFWAVLMFLLYPLWITIEYSIPIQYYKWRSRPKIADPGRVYTLADIRSRKEAPERKFGIKRGLDKRKSVKEAISDLGGMENFVKEGDTVVIKINVCGGVPGREGSYTSIDLTEEVMEILRKAGAKEVKLVDTDMAWTNFWPAAKDIGWVDWGKEYNDRIGSEFVEIINLSETEKIYFDFGEPAPSELRKEIVSKLMVDADVIISIPAMKTHTLTEVTLGMKNMYGTSPDIDKAKYHRIGINGVIFFMTRAFTPNLTIIDRSIGGEAAGPLHIKPIYYQTLVVSNDVVMADSVASQLMGWKPLDKEEGIVHIRMAHEEGLGDASVTVDLDELPYPHRKDGTWERPYAKVTQLYDRLIFYMLKIPGMCFFFSLVSDFFAYDLLRLPIIGDIVVALLSAMNKFLRLLDLELPRTKETMKHEILNVLYVSLIAACSFYFFVTEGFMNGGGFYFKSSYLAAIVVALMLATRLRTKELVSLTVSAMIIGAIIETLGPTVGTWQYIGNMAPPLYSVFTWPLIIIGILGFAHIFNDLVAKLNLVKVYEEKRIVRLLPVIVTYLSVVYLMFEEMFYDPTILLMYSVMEIFGSAFSYFHNWMGTEYLDYTDPAIFAQDQSGKNIHGT